MKVVNSVKHVLILGAGASVDYGLPVWRDLSDLAKKEIITDTKNIYKHKKEILEWLEKVGANKEYDSIDRCIEKESTSSKYPDGSDIENELFLIMKSIFDKMYKSNDQGWIRTLNEKILNSKKEDFENSLFFVNYNYDDVLERNFLNFSYLHKKHYKYKYRLRLTALSTTVVDALYPHGKFSKNEEDGSHISIRKQTMKSHQEEDLDVISCYDGEQHDIFNYTNIAFELYILGLGGGLKTNLNNLRFPNNSIAKIHVTIKESSLRSDILRFLTERFQHSEIIIYPSCEDLVSKCFDD